MAVTATVRDYQALPAVGSAPSNNEWGLSSSGSGDGGALVGNSKGTGNSTRPIAPAPGNGTLAAVFTMLALKALVFVFALRPGQLEKGQGAQGSAGFSALFTFSSNAADQYALWSVADWAAWASDAENATGVLSYRKGRITEAILKQLNLGCQLAGAECKVVDL
eukprot:gene29918-13328_t